VAGFALDRRGAEIRARCGIVLGDERAWYWRLSGRLNLEFFGALSGLNPERASRRASEVLDLVGLAAMADRPFATYSTGMRLRLSLGRALIAAPSVLLLDEPTRSVDLQGRRAFHQLLLGLVREQAVAILMATHDLEEAVELADRVVVLSEGRIRSEMVRPGRAEIEAALGSA
jgi:ABC-2 type transport system ATP-binding protein